MLDAFRIDAAAIDVIGSAAGTLTTLAFIPQVAKAWRSRSVGDLSLLTMVAFASGVGLWLVYGLLLAAWPIVAANGITLILTVLLLVMKLAWR